MTTDKNAEAIIYKDPVQWMRNIVGTFETDDASICISVRTIKEILKNFEALQSAPDSAALQQSTPAEPDAAPAAMQDDAIRSQALLWASKSGATTKEESDKIYATHCELRDIKAAATRKDAP